MKRLALAATIFASALAEAGSPNKELTPDPKSGITFPADDKTDVFCGAVRHQFSFHGHNAWIVVPQNPLPGKHWFAVPEWPTAFSNRNGVQHLLDMGFYMVHVNLLGEFANEKALGVMFKMYEFLQSSGFQKKGAFIGMSLGGLYSFRYAQAHPETVACIYADAPVCDLNYSQQRGTEILKAYNTTSKEVLLQNSPVNQLDKIAKAKIPILLLLGMVDNVVDPATNGVLLAERYQALGGSIQVIKRDAFAHHPHGMDNPAQILGFILYHTINKE